ncbi:FCD domain-containing protein [Streptomyces sp. NBC_01016]|uniref:FadR/GntR family transcriptional regulator n=1 Tax=Streptomyces sp. NBC_01016 TaxID=2903720 RepID=UPI002256C426|nr:FCD domain-containing protein [Streptomyces sp. NBC_01016]MCX4835818.1 FCD domain-containing protein [Streptomyces sp. NBC_01016]
MTATDTAAAGLRAMIASGELAAGAQLPPEPDLCARLGVSRGSLREAVRSLAALGMLEPRHGAGTFVSALRPAHMLAGFAAMVDVLPLDGILELFDTRRAVECQAAALAAARADGKVIARLRELQARLSATEDEQELHDLDHEFHTTICAASGNETLAALAGVLRSRGRHYNVYGSAQGTAVRAASDQGHEALIDALAAHDPTAAAAAAGAHLTRTERWLRQLRPAPEPG